MSSDKLKDLFRLEGTLYSSDEETDSDRTEDTRSAVDEKRPCAKRVEMTLDETGTFDLDIDEVINLLLNNFNKPEWANLSQTHMQLLAIISREIFKNEKSVLEIKAPIRICGDLHGQFNDLIRIFKLAGDPQNRKYLFLGDYIDRGSKGLECICLLFAYKIKYPDQIYLLRGNHETEAVSRIYGFRDEIITRFSSSKLWWTFLRTFNYLPLAAIIEESVFCCHGGLSPEFMQSRFTSLTSELNKINRPLEVPAKGLICDLLWANPLDQVGKSVPLGFIPNERGCSWSFGFDVIERFLDKFDLDLIVRAHQVVEDGYEFYANRKLITIFSAPNYCGEFDNAGAIFCLDYNEKNQSTLTVDGGFIILKPRVEPHFHSRNWLKSIGIGIKQMKDSLASKQN